MNQSSKKFSTYLSIKTQSLPNKLPDFSVSLNNLNQLPTHNQDNIVTFDMSAVFGNNVITIDFFNKHNSDTIVNASGQIVADLNLEIIELKIQDTDVTHQLKQRLTYVTCDQEYANTYGFMHKNGKLTIEFQCPIFYFLRNIALIKQTH